MTLARLVTHLTIRSALFPLLFLGGLLAGCSHYQLGTGGQLKFTTLFIAPVASTAIIPQAQAVVTTQLRESFLKDGRTRLVNSAAEADAVLNVTLVRYQREIAVAQPNDTGLARRIDVVLEARATLKDNRSRQLYFTDRPLSVKRGAFADSGLIGAEYQLLPLLAEDLANETAHAVLDTW